MVATFHRPSNVDARESLESVLELLRQVSARTKVVLPIHPRTLASLQQFGLMQALETVSEQIRRKIGWDADLRIVVNDEQFLRAFYAAMRAHLERKMLFGKRREDKYSTE